jgi:hypothetical protein
MKVYEKLAGLFSMVEHSKDAEKIDQYKKEIMDLTDVDDFNQSTIEISIYPNYQKSQINMEGEKLVFEACLPLFCYNDEEDIVGINELVLVNHTLIVTPSFIDGFDLEVKGKNNSEGSDFLYGIFYDCLNKEIQA